MFLDVRFCEDYDVRIEKIVHMATAITEDRGSVVGDLEFLLEGIQRQDFITEKTKALADYFDRAYDDNLDYCEKQDWMYNNGYGNGILVELSFHQPNQCGRPLLYIYAENELEVRAFAEQVTNSFWAEPEDE